MAGSSSGSFTQFDWLISGRDFPVMTAVITKFLMTGWRDVCGNSG